MESPFKVGEDFLILCEGPHDAAFLKKLIEHYSIAGYQITDPLALGAKGGGITQFPNALRRIAGATDRERLRGVVVIGDNDTSPKGAIEFMRTAIRDTPKIGRRKLRVPRSAMTKTNWNIRTAIIGWPKRGQEGNIETLLVPVAERSVSPVVRACVDAFYDCGHFANEHIAKSSKAKMRFLVACSRPSEADMSFRETWSKLPTLVPIGDQAFVWIADFLRAFQQ